MNIEVKHAISFAEKKHGNQTDDLGNNYFQNHCLIVMEILEKVTSDYKILSAGILHDVLEDTGTTYEELEKEFGKEIADLVNEVTHDGRKDEIGYYFPRLESKGAILIKFADRLSNLSRMTAWDEKRQSQYLRKSKFWKSNAEEESR